MTQLFISENGRVATLVGQKSSRPLPALPHPLLSRMAALNGLLNSAEASDGELREIINRLSNHIVSEAEDLFGDLDDNTAIVYSASEGGWSCGSTGRPPIPLKRRPDRPIRPDELRLDDVLDTGRLRVGSGVRNLIKGAHDKKVNLGSVFKQPDDMAKKLGIEISKSDAEILRTLSPAGIKSIEDPDRREIAEFISAVMDDGRFIDSWHKKPVAVANALDVELTDRLHDNIVEIGASFDDPTVMSPIIKVVGIAITGIIAVTVAVTADEAGPRIDDIMDRSGRDKF